MEKNVLFDDGKTPEQRQRIYEAESTQPTYGEKMREFKNSCKQKPNSWPKYGIFEVTNVCQLRCPGCYMVENDALGKNAMTLNQAINILDKIKKFRGGKELETVDILGGEPLLWNELKPFILELKKRNIEPWIFTNMLTITDGLAKFLFKNKVKITGKMNTFPSEEYLSKQADLIGAPIRTAQKMWDSVDIFLENGYKESGLFFLENLVRKENIQQVPAWYEWCLEKGITPDVEMLGCSSGFQDQIMQDQLPSNAELKKLVSELVKIRTKFNLETTTLMPHFFSSCRFFDNGLYFDVKGNIRACSNSNVYLGNINEKDALKNAFNSKLIKSRRNILEIIEEPCNSCEKLSECRGGCRATSEGGGNFAAGYEICPLV